MKVVDRTLRICKKGHRYYKSGDCPVCPVCNQDNKPGRGFLRDLASPARNALLEEGIDTVDKLSAYTEQEILALHGIGPASLPVLKRHLGQAGKAFRD